MIDAIRIAQLGQLTLEELSERIAVTSDESLAALMSDRATRGPMLDILYEETVAMLRPEPFEFGDEVIHWHVSGAPEGGCDSFQLLIEGGIAWPGRCLTRLPRCSFEIRPVALLRHFEGQPSMNRVIEDPSVAIGGDLAFASRVGELFSRKTFG
jgi:hypothetical protein